MAVTNMGKGWEIRNSLWIIWTFVPALNWIPFFWIGSRAKQRKWILFGCLYLLLCLILPGISGEKWVEENQLVRATITPAFGLAWLASIFQAFLSRKEYLVRRETIINTRQAADNAYRQQIQNSYLQQHGYSQQSGIQATATPQTPPSQPVSQIPTYQQPPQPNQKINLNTASEHQLTSLPGVGVALAKRAVEIRTQIGGFISVEDFIQRLALMPHFAVQIENLAFIEPGPIPPPENTGRVIDI
ncbi:MAG: helix-hairpin-helix domain-containing protein [Clostridiales bacterium]|nr:helix-hairpin-helix domain-containing protein [Clostridiales bacterium]